MKQYCALQFTVLSVPAILLLPQVGWLWSSAAVVIALLLVRFAQVGAFTLPWNFLALGASADLLCEAFPNSNILIGLLLLLLAAYAASKGREIVLRVAAIVFFLHIILYGLLLGFSLPNAEISFAAPQKPFALLSVLAVVPCAMLAPEKKSGWKVVGAIAVFIVLTSLVGKGDFYAAMKSVSILGAMERLEPLVSVSVTMGGFCLLSMLCCVNEKLISQKFPEQKKWTGYLNFLLGSACIWLSRLLGTTTLAIGTAIFWGLIPLLAQSLGNSKKFEKNEKNA